MKIQAITLFPEMFDSITGYGVTGRAAKQGLWQFSAINPRRFADNKLRPRPGDLSQSAR